MINILMNQKPGLTDSVYIWLTNYRKQEPGTGASRANSQRAHDVRMTSDRRRCDGMTSYRR